MSSSASYLAEGVRVHSGADPPGETTRDPSLDDPFPDYDTEPVMAFSALKRPAAPECATRTLFSGLRLSGGSLFDFPAHFCHSASRETHAFGFRLPANARRAKSDFLLSFKRFPISLPFLPTDNP
jgi:hypothetical protein